MWGYVMGGMGMVSFILCDIARDAGAVVLTGVPVARIIPGEGVELEGGERIESPCVVSNADPRVTLRLLGADADPAGERRSNRFPRSAAPSSSISCSRSYPASRPGREPRCRIISARSIRRSRRTSGERTSQIARAGELPERLWTELYFHTAHDPSIAPAGMHTMSVFAQYVPHTFARGDWDIARTTCKNLAIRSIARYCDNMPEAILDVQVLGPPDIEREVGLTGGHIFQGECLPPICGTSD